jgi:hypothetical protein
VKMDIVARERGWRCDGIVKGRLDGWQELRDGDGRRYCGFIGELCRELNVMTMLANRLNTYGSQLDRPQLAIEKAAL